MCPYKGHPERGVDTTTALFALRNGYYDWCIPEFDDDQRLQDGNGKDDYGSIAHVFAEPGLSLLTSHTQFDGKWVKVAIIVVDDAGSSASLKPYMLLGLGNHNCMYLQHYDPAVGKSTFSAIIVPPDGTDHCPVTPDPKNSRDLEVKIEKYTENGDDYPPVTRFIEGNGGLTLIGVKCTNRWCDIGPKRFGDVPHSAHYGNSIVSVRSARKRQGLV